MEQHSILTYGLNMNMNTYMYYHYLKNVRKLDMVHMPAPIITTSGRWRREDETF